jgi:hypothetical protein
MLTVVVNEPVARTLLGFFEPFPQQVFGNVTVPYQFGRLAFKKLG